MKRGTQVRNTVVTKKHRKHIDLEYEDQISGHTHYQVWQPANWKTTLEHIKQMRAARDAPVDTMGAAKCAESNISPQDYRFQTLISLMLSSQTRDQVTFSAMEKLQQHELTVDKIMNTSDNTLGQLIYPVSFWKRKIQYIKKTCKILQENYNNDIPSNVEELIKLPGVGKKMAYLCMDIAWDKTVGIGVDIHVHRISNRLKWTKVPSKTQEDTRLALECWLPQSMWREINLLLVGFGQQICSKVKPKCDGCLNKAICPSAIKSKKPKSVK